MLYIQQHPSRKMRLVAALQAGRYPCRQAAIPAVAPPSRFALPVYSGCISFIFGLYSSSAGHPTCEAPRGSDMYAQVLTDAVLMLHTFADVYQAVVALVAESCPDENKWMQKCNRGTSMTSGITQ